MTKKYLKWLALAALVSACESPLETNPSQQIDAATALKSAAAIQQALNGAYRSLSTDGLYSRQEVVFPDLYADNHDFTGTFQTDREISLRNVQASNTAIGGTTGTWPRAYQCINRANNILAAVEDVEMAEADARVARGEALFLRGLCYSVLARWFGGVPILTEPTVGIDESATRARSTLQEVYAFIEKDLEEASTLLSPARRNGRATKGAADALLARVYLEDAKYAQARDKATAVISNTTYRLVTNYRDLYTTKHTVESIFELHYQGGENTNSLAFWHFPSALGGRYGFRPSTSLNNAYEAGDTRRAASIGLSGTSRYGIKYHRISTQDDNVHVLRLAEMYLIRAEANMRLNAAPEIVRADLDIVRARAGLAALPATVDTQGELIDAILQERRVELAMEGHRFFDLRRLGRATTVLQIAQEKLLMPVPQRERDANPALTQNPGY
jgi:starch-binding outer membrane protein, SusD/RagB family